MGQGLFLDCIKGASRICRKPLSFGAITQGPLRSSMGPAFFREVRRLATFQESSLMAAPSCLAGLMFVL